jgi:uncharacterized phage protein (TIGR01671 family)
MREILFRGKRVDNGEWMEGFFIRILNPFTVSGEPIRNCICDGTNIFPEVYPETVGQYTGLTDKNGKKIFEGDILREPPGDDWEKKNFVGFEVFYHDNDSCDSHVGWQMNRLHFYGALCGADIYPRSFRPAWTNKMEVVGNIHDNPEMIYGWLQ